MPEKYHVLLINPPFKCPIIRDNYCSHTPKAAYLWPPVDLLYLSGIFHHPHIRLTVIDAVASSISWQELLNDTCLEHVDVCIALTSATSHVEDMLNLNCLKKKTNAQLYVMGNFPNYEPGVFLKLYPFTDGIIHNFFDTTLINIVTNPTFSDQIKSLTLNAGKKSQIFGSANHLYHSQIISLPHPPHFSAFPLNKYQTPIARKYPMTTMLTSFGCPFSCSFCTASGLKYKMRTQQSLVAEFDAIKRSGIKEIFFEDSTFNADRDYLHLICEILIRKQYHFSWSANIHSFQFSDEDARLMKLAGCHTVQIGVESGNEEILHTYAPSKQQKNIKDIFSICKRNGIKTLGYFILGFPDESTKMSEKTIRFAQELNPTYASFTILTPDYGTDMRKKFVGLSASSSHLYSEINANSPENSQAFVRLDIQKKLLIKANISFYFRPSKIWEYVKDYKLLGIFIRNGCILLRSLFL